MKFASVTCVLVLAAGGVLAQAPTATLFENVMVFDGTTAALTGPSNVLIEGNLIARVTDEPIDAGPATTRITGDGRTLMPGLIDAHWHAILARPTSDQIINGDIGYTNLVAGDEATDTLMRGFTTVRDMGGPVFGLKRAIEGLVVGPRIYPSGAMITVTSGHGDFRQPWELTRSTGGPPSRIEELGGAAIADSPDEVRLRVREQLMLGASQVKLTAGGGVASPHSPLDVSTFTPEELRAAVEAADNWGTYVAVHAYTPEAIRQSVEAGVKVIEHAHLIDEPTAQLMADEDVWLSTQPFAGFEAAIPFPPGSDQAMKLGIVLEGTDRLYELAREYGIRTAFGTDVLFSQALAARQGEQLVGLTRWYTPAEALTMATSINGELLQLTGPRNPYPGLLGVVAEGALADLLLVDGDPLEDIGLVADPERSFVVIMKDGVVYRNALP